MKVTTLNIDFLSLSNALLSFALHRACSLDRSHLGHVYLTCFLEVQEAICDISPICLVFTTSGCLSLLPQHSCSTSSSSCSSGPSSHPDCRHPHPPAARYAQLTQVHLIQLTMTLSQISTREAMCLVRPANHRTSLTVNSLT